MPTSRYYQTTVNETDDHYPSTRNSSSDEEARLVTKTVSRGADKIRHIGQVFTTSERAVLHGIAVCTDHTEQSAEQWAMYSLAGITLRELLDKIISSD
ncbi:MAG: hypothetical protein HRU15_10950, partial [Planctomycetes bacterium]|nr:hypothetical protein [Planctomycetota bacterium]